MARKQADLAPSSKEPFLNRHIHAHRLRLCSNSGGCCPTLNKSLNCAWQFHSSLISTISSLQMINPRESFTLCPAFSSDGKDIESRVILPGTIRQQWETGYHRQFQIIPEAGLGIRATPFEVSVSDRNLPASGTISTHYLAIQRRMPIIMPLRGRAEQQAYNARLEERVTGDHYAFFAAEAHQAASDGDHKSDSGEMDTDNRDGVEEIGEAAEGTQDLGPSVGIVRNHHSMKQAERHGRQCNNPSVFL